MGHRNDDKHTALTPPGQTDDLEQAFHGGPQDNDGWLAYFQANGATSDEYNTAAKEFLLAQGIADGALPDMWAEYWAGGGVPPVDILTNLVSYYSLEEASGNRIDAHGSNDLGPFNAPGNAAGKVNNCLDCANNQTVFLNPCPADLAGGDRNFSVFGWVKIDAFISTFQTLLWNSTAAGLSSASGFSYGININSQILQFVVASGSTYYTAPATNFGTLSTGTWYFFAAGYDADNNQAWISVNGSAKEIISSVPAPNIGTSFLYVISCDVGSFQNDGQSDEFGFYDDVLSDDQIAFLYNSGNGRAYADLT